MSEADCGQRSIAVEQDRVGKVMDPKRHRTSASPTLVWVLLSSILGLASVVRFVGIGYDFPYMLEVDEQIVARATLGMLKAHSLDPHFYYYGPLLIYIESLWLLPYLAIRGMQGHSGVPSIKSFASWTSVPSDPYLHVYGRIPFVIIGVATVALAFIIGRKIAGNAAGLLAALFLALSPLHSYQSHFLLPNAATSFFALLAVWFVLRYLEQQSEAGSKRPTNQSINRRLLMGGESHNLILATVAASLGACIKYNAVVLLLIPGIAVAMERTSLSDMTRRCIRLAAVAMATFFVVTPPAVFNTVAFVHGAGYQIKHYALLGSGDNTPSILWNTQYLVMNEGLLLFPVALTGMAIMAWKTRDSAVTTLLVVVLAYYLLLGVQRAHYDRNLLVILPLISVGGACVIARMARMRPLGLVVGLVCTATILINLVDGTSTEVSTFLRTPAQLVTRTWLDAHLPRNTHLLADEYTVPPLSRSDVHTTFVPTVQLTPHELRQSGIDYVVVSKSLAYYRLDLRRRVSVDAVLQPVYGQGAIEVFRVQRRG